MKTTAIRMMWACFLLTAAACGGSETTGGGPSGSEPADPLEVVQAKAGTYEGSWELFGRDASGGVASAMSWTDVAVADMPTVEDTRAYVHVTDSMDLSSGMHFEQQWIEGVLIKEDGGVGPQFIEMDGVVTELEEVEPNHFRYQTELSSDDLYFLEGITAQNLIDGYHVTDKVVTEEEGRETHHITRTTHVEWTDASGSAATDEFESLKGTHKKAP